MNKIIFLLFIEIIVIARSSFASDLSNLNLTHCKPTIRIREKTAYIGWPIMLSCIKIVPWYAESGECQIFDNVTGQLLYNETITIKNFEYQASEFYNGDVTLNASTSYIVWFQAEGETECNYEEVKLKVEEIPQVSCQESFELHNRNVTFEPRFGAANKKLECSFHGVDINFPANKSEVRWLRGCLPYSINKTGNTKLEPDPIPGGEWRQDLLISNVDWSNAGVYTCAVTYNNKTLYVVHQNFCIKHVTPTTGAPTLQCDKPSAVVLGQNARITCYSKSQESTMFHGAVWNKTNKLQVDDNGKKESKEVCRRLVAGSNSTKGLFPNYQCTVKMGPKVEDRCFSSDDVDRGLQKEKQTYTITLLIVNTKKEDFGEYELSFQYMDTKAKATIILKEDMTGLTKQAISGIAVGIILAVLVCVLICLICCNLLYIKWFWRKKFAPYETAHKKYDVYLAYYFSNENDKMSDDSREIIKSLVTALYDLLQEKNMKTFDDQREVAENGYCAENLQVQNDCHRILIILTPEYIKDYWSLHTAYQALQNLIEKGAELIIVTTPATRQAITEVNHHSAAALNRALKMYNVIKWNGKLPLNKNFVRHLEYSMPKLSDAYIPKAEKPIVYSAV